MARINKNLAHLANRPGTYSTHNCPSPQEGRGEMPQSNGSQDEQSRGWKTHGSKLSSPPPSLCRQGIVPMKSCHSHHWQQDFALAQGHYMICGGSTNLGTLVASL
jgi:hypothetical protein